ncbi:MAG: 4Fe-4S binding protein [Thermodesulfobacteriota bacterium]
MLKSIHKNISGLWSLIVGLRVTGQNFFRPQITVHYPRQEADNVQDYRGHVELVPSKQDPKIPKCIACGACARICPSGCIHIQSEKIPLQTEGKETEKEEENKAKTSRSKKILTKFNLDFNYCSLCGLCVQNCPVNSLRFSNNIYLAGHSPQEFRFDLLQRLRNQSFPTPGEDD